MFVACKFDFHLSRPLLTTLFCCKINKIKILLFFILFFIFLFFFCCLTQNAGDTVPAMTTFYSGWNFILITSIPVGYSYFKELTNCSN